MYILERNLAIYFKNQSNVYASVSGRMLLDVTENPDSNWLKQRKIHYLTHNRKARERQASG